MTTMLLFLFAILSSASATVPTYQAISPDGYCNDYIYATTGTRSGSYDSKTNTAAACIPRCQAVVPGTSSFYLKVATNQCGCSSTTTGACSIKTDALYKSYQITAGTFGTLACSSGSPSNCVAGKIYLPGYSAGDTLLRIKNGITARRSTEADSCPYGWKIWSPRTKADFVLVWNAFSNTRNAFPRSPSLIVDVTRTAACTGCGGAMNSGNAQMAPWATKDGSAWWLRDTTYSEPSGDYHTNCYLEIGSIDAALNDVRTNDNNCNYRSSTYLCQPVAIPTGVTTRGCTCANGTPQAACRTSGLSLCESCNSGFAINTAKTACTDINECNSNRGGCNANRPCQNTAGSHTCGNCNAGYVNNGATGCTACPRGSTCNNGVATVCDTAKYVRNNVCTVCPTGYTCDGAIACANTRYLTGTPAVCTNCPSGHTCNGVTKTACAVTKYVTSNVCTNCPAFYTCNGASRTSCSSARYVLANVCTACPTGLVCNGNVACPKTSYVNSNGACTPCAVGYTCNGRTTSKCVGYRYIKDNQCLTCPYGYTCNGATATACAITSYVTSNVCTACPTSLTACNNQICVCNGAIACAINRYVKNGACWNCPTGYVCNGAVACLPSQYVKEGVCTACPSDKTCDGIVMSSGNSAELHLLMSLVVLFFASLY